VGVQVYFHATLRKWVQDQEWVEVTGNTVGQCFNQLVQQYPGLKEKLFDKKGKIHNLVEIYVNQESAYPDELAKVVKDGDKIQVTLLLSGG
jgi:molybdopterin converting factor small subunit